MKTGKFKSTGLLVILTVAISFIILTILYGDLVFHPDKYLFSDTGDGISSYYNFGWHARYDKDFFQFDGMNYPYGESIFYSVNMPLFASIARLTGKVFPTVADHPVGITNMLMLLSVLVSSCFLFLIFNRLKINYLLAVIASLCISFLAPQVQRMGGHFSLAFSFFIPLTIYLIIVAESSGRKLLLSFVFFIICFCWFCVHPYLGIISVILVLFHWLITYILQFRDLRMSLINYTKLFISVALPLLAFKLLVTLTDHHTGRTTNPYGFLVYNADLKSVFLPNSAMEQKIISSVIPYDNFKYEGYAYIGVLSLAVILVSWFIYICRVIGKGIYSFHGWKNRPLILTSLMITGIIFFLFSMGFPFRLNMGFLLNWFPFIKQFRASGRFTWILFYAITIWSVYKLNQAREYFISGKWKIPALIICLLPLTYLCEGIPYHQSIAERALRIKNLFNPIENSEISRLSDIPGIEKYQAIIPLPYYHKGSENFEQKGTDKILKWSVLASYRLHKPLVGSYLAHTSIPEARKCVQLMSPGFYKKTIEADMTDDRPFLVICSNEELTGYENDILKRSHLLLATIDFSAYSISRSELFENTSTRELQEFKKKLTALEGKNGFQVSDTTSFIYFDDFHSMPSETWYGETGAAKGYLRDYTKLASFVSGTFDPTKSYSLSYWIYNNGDNYGQDRFNLMTIIIETNGKTEKWTNIGNPAYSQVINGDWTLLEMNFKVENPSDLVSVVIKGDDALKTSFIIDDLLIREANNDVYRLTAVPDSCLFINNQWIKPDR